MWIEPNCRKFSKILKMSIELNCWKIPTIQVRDWKLGLDQTVGNLYGLKRVKILIWDETNRGKFLQFEWCGLNKGVGK